MTGPGGEPEIAPGETSDWVLQLQTRLQGLGWYEGALDGHFGPATEHGVAELRSRSGSGAIGPVDARTWELLASAEAGATGGADAMAPTVGTVSEDHQWRWDGEGWQPNDIVPVPAPAVAQGGSGGHLSADGQWIWDGDQWQAVST